MMGYDGWKCSIPVPATSTKDYAEMAVIPTMKQCRYYAAIATLDYSVYIIGGQDCGFGLNIVEKYDVLRNRWESLSPLPISVHGCGAAFVNSRLYLVGGRSSKQNENRVWVITLFKTVVTPSSAKNCITGGFTSKLIFFRSTTKNLTVGMRLLQ